MKDVVCSLRDRLVHVGKQLYDQGLVIGTEGNISARIPGTDRILIKPSGVSMGSLRAEDFIVVDLDGNKVEGKLSPSIETPLHTAIYNVRSDVHGVVHTHAPFATAFGIAGIEIIPLQVEMFLYIPNGVPILPFELPGSRALAEAVQKLIRDFNAVILENHGVITVGSTIEEACLLNRMVEECAKVQFVATMLAGKDAVSWETLKGKLLSKIGSANLETLKSKFKVFRI
ncbi:MAG: class II aldolase/adducin family protein [Candidatus Bathyarchaeia archaeon]|nr:class II aldolase/adducin family protein [Candidatus Bathyarchaeota archaeon]